MHSKRRCSSLLTNIWEPRFLLRNPSRRTDSTSIAACCSRREQYLLTIADTKRHLQGCQRGRSQELRVACLTPVSYTHLRAHETDSYLVCRLLLEKKKTKLL